MDSRQTTLSPWLKNNSQQYLTFRGANKSYQPHRTEMASGVMQNRYYNTHKLHNIRFGLLSFQFTKWPTVHIDLQKEKEVFQCPISLLCLNSKNGMLCTSDRNQIEKLVIIGCKYINIYAWKGNTRCARCRRWRPRFWWISPRSTNCEEPIIKSLGLVSLWLITTSKIIILLQTVEATVLE